MSFRRQEQDADWPRWLREHRADLAQCGLPQDAFDSELHWFQFLEHGYVQSKDKHVGDWWSIRFMTLQQARSLRDFVNREYGTQVSDLVRELEALIHSRDSSVA